MERAPIIIAPVSDDCVRRRCSIFLRGAAGRWNGFVMALGSSSVCLSIPFRPRAYDSTSLSFHAADADECSNSITCIRREHELRRTLNCLRLS